MKKKELIMIAIILLLSGIVYIGNSWNNQQSSHALAVVYVNGEEYGRYNLEIEQRVEINLQNGDYNILDIHDHLADMKDASCPDSLCVHQHPIDQHGESIICLPNKVVVEIEGDDKSDFDMVAN